MRGVLFMCMMTALLMESNAQEETYPDRISIQKQKPVSRSTLVAGIEMSTTAYIEQESKDSSGTAPYLSVGLNYYHRSGAGIKLKTYGLLKGSGSDLYLTSLSLYYTNYTGKLIPYVSYSRHWQHNRTAVPYSPIQNEFFGMARLASGILEPLAGIDIGFGKDEDNGDEAVTDVMAFAGVSHVIRWQPQNSEVFLYAAPSLQLNAGTDRYFSYTRLAKYISRNRSMNDLRKGGQGNGSPGNNGQPAEAAIVNETNEFTLSNIEANLYLSLSVGRFYFEPSGSLYFPLRKDVDGVYGYWQLGVRYQF